MELDIIILSKVTLSWKDKHGTFSRMWALAVTPHLGI